MWGTAVCLGQPGLPFFSRILGEVEKCSGACLRLRAHPDLEEDVQTLPGRVPGSRSCAPGVRGEHGCRTPSPLRPTSSAGK